MFLRTKVIYASLMLASLTTFGAIVHAQQPSTQTRMGRGEGRGLRRGRGPGGGFGPGALRELNLTDAQKQQVRSMIQQDFEGNKALREELRQLGEKRGQGTLTAEDQARARTLHEQMRTSMKDRKTKIAALLTAEQKTKLEALRKERKADREDFGGKRRGFRGKHGQGDPTMQKPTTSPAINIEICAQESEQT